MKHLKLNASEYYRVHCKKIFESSYTKEKDCSLNLTPKAEARMTAAFNLLFNYMPAALVPYMQYAANVAPELYNNMQTLADVNLYSKVKFEKIKISPETSSGIFFSIFIIIKMRINNWLF